MGREGYRVGAGADGERTEGFAAGWGPLRTVSWVAFEVEDVKAIEKKEELIGNRGVNVR